MSSSNIKPIKSNILMSRRKASTPNFKFKHFEIDQKNHIETNKNNAIINPEWLKEIYKNLSANQLKENDPNIQVRLEARQLWQEFSSICTEMIITKCGR